jgi:hypothetical protein
MRNGRKMNTLEREMKEKGNRRGEMAWRSESNKSILSSCYSFLLPPVISFCQCFLPSFIF